MSEPRDGTFLFADLAGFTALTEVHGDAEAADLAAGFFDSVRALLSEHKATEVKVIGDELMIRGEDAGQAVRLGLRIIHEIGARHRFPAIRIGIHTGPAVERDGDWFGSTVNVAARIAGIATGGEVLLSDQTRQAAGAVENLEFEQRGRRELKNIREPVLLFAAVRPAERTEKGLPIDPVCHMAVDPEHCAGSLRHEGGEYHFCSLRCAAAFASRPGDYTEDTISG